MGIYTRQKKRNPPNLQHSAMLVLMVISIKLKTWQGEAWYGM
jgi:hypothetical protein